MGNVVPEGELADGTWLLPNRAPHVNFVTFETHWGSFQRDKMSWKKRTCDWGEMCKQRYSIFLDTFSILTSSQMLNKEQSLFFTNRFHPSVCGRMAGVCSSQIQHLASNRNYQPGSSSNRSNRSQRNTKSRSPFHRCRHHSYLWSHSSVPNCNSRRYHMAGSLEDRSLENQPQVTGTWSWRLIDQLKLKAVSASCRYAIHFCFLSMAIRLYLLMHKHQI